MKVGRGVFKAFDSRVISRKHGYQRCVQVGRGRDKKRLFKQLGRCSNANNCM